MLLSCSADLEISEPFSFAIIVILFKILVMAVTGGDAGIALYHTLGRLPEPDAFTHKFC